MTFEQEVFILANETAKKIMVALNLESKKNHEEIIENSILKFQIQVEKFRKQLDPAYIKARQIAANFIEFPSDEEDRGFITNATPLQAIVALEVRLKKVLLEQNAKCK